MKLTQCDRILRHLRDYGSITSMTAINEYGILRLASRINDLRRKGFTITSEMVEGENRYNEKVHYSVYRLIEKQENPNGTD